MLRLLVIAYIWFLSLSIIYHQDGQPQQEDSPESLFHKKMEELTQQHLSFNTRLGDNSKPLRALDLGQDRFKRRYWVLPNLGGVSQLKFRSS